MQLIEGERYLVAVGGEQLIGRYIASDGEIALFEFNESRNVFHDGDGRGKDKHCWWLFKTKVIASVANKIVCSVEGEVEL